MLSSVAHCDMEDSKVLNNLFFFLFHCKKGNKSALLLTRSLCLSHTWLQPLWTAEHPVPTSQGYKGPAIPVIVMTGFIHPPFCLKEKWCTPGQNFKNKHGIYGPEKASHSCATPASSLIQHGSVHCKNTLVAGPKDTGWQIFFIYPCFEV